MIEPMSDRERFLRTMRYEPVDRRPLHVVSIWPDTLRRWHGEGLAADVTSTEQVHEYMGVTPMRVTNITPIAGLFPFFEERTIREEENTRVGIDSYGRTVRSFKDHTSMPEWIDFPVKCGEDLRRVMDEHFDVDDLDARFTDEWQPRIDQAAARNDVIMIDGGCYYWTLRSLAGVDGASYLLYDAAELVDELFERYFTVVMEGLRRAVKQVKIDAIGFGEDIAFKTGPLISPEMFRRFILPRYRKAMDFAHEHGVAFTWYDSDGDLRMFFDDYLAVGINTVVPCEVAAGMDPVALRRDFGRAMRLIGGVDKREVAKGREAIDRLLDYLAPVVEDGGFMPAIDHSVPADVSWDNYRYFMDRLQEVLNKPGL